MNTQIQNIHFRLVGGASQLRSKAFHDHEATYLELNAVALLKHRKERVVMTECIEMGLVMV